MVLAIQVAGLLCLSSAPSFARSWWGALVDSKCYASEQRNVNPTDTLTSVDRDRDHEIRYCSPRAKTTSFTFVDRDGLSFNLDSEGNVKAADLVQKNGRKSFFAVDVSGEISGNIVKVDSISMAR